MEKRIFAVVSKGARSTVSHKGVLEEKKLMGSAGTALSKYLVEKVMYRVGV